MPYREETPRAFDLEIAALHDLLARSKRVRRRFALPVVAVAIAASLAGAVAHVGGYWSVFGVTDQGTYFLSLFSVLSACAICAAPILAVGWPLYVVARARTRSAWRSDHARAGVTREWLDENVRRYG